KTRFTTMKSVSFRITGHFTTR
ncbi:hypothetical protein D043_2608B, partial [Vibrio parahaemolyticus EKP-021]